MSAVDPLSVHVPDHLGDVDYEALILEAPIEDPWSLRVPMRHASGEFARRHNTRGK